MCILVLLVVNNRICFYSPIAVLGWVLLACCSKRITLYFVRLGLGTEFRVGTSVNASSKRNKRLWGARFIASCYVLGWVGNLTTHLERMGAYLCYTESFLPGGGPS